MPYWTVSATFRLDQSVFEAAYEKNPIDTKAEADAIVKTSRNKKGTVRNMESKKVLINPPTPFDLGDLQSEAYRLFRYTPMFTLKVAQRLYLDALISYPRTNSQRLPISIGYKTILQKLAENEEHGRLANELLAKPELKPKEGKGFDPAHPAIYPTGNRPDRMLNTAERRIWNLVVRRFMGAFAESSIQQTIKATIAVDVNEFTLTGRQTVEEGWMHFYKPFVHSNDFVFPRLAKGQEIDIENIAAQNEFTKPPPRYNPSSLLKKMQKENLGTKSTRAGIIQTLYDRKYITQERIVVTEVGFEVVRVLQQYCPDVLSSKLTAKLEEAMSEIQEKNETRQILLERVIEILQTITVRLKEQESAIGEQLSRALTESRLEESTVGTCPMCKTGKLAVLHSKKTGKRFVGCTNYFKNTCTTAFPLPQRGVVKPLHNVCASCGSPTVQIYQKGKNSWKLCINPVCSKKQPGGKAK
jgi:DNA topoisomerase-1